MALSEIYPGAPKGEKDLIKAVDDIRRALKEIYKELKRLEKEKLDA